MSIVIVLSGAAAHAQNWRHGTNIHPESFFDFERAKGFWGGLKTREQFKSWIDANCPDDGPYSAWRRLYDRNPVEAGDQIKTNPAAVQIKRCHDMQLTIYKWDWFHRAWLDRLIHHKAPFNQVPVNTRSCGELREINIFTGQCNDAPDWRTPQGVAADEKAIAGYRGKPVSKADRLD